MVGIIKDYATKRLDLIKLEATEKSAKATGSIVFFALVVFFGILLVMFSFIGFGIWLGMYLGNYAYGFLSIAGVLLLIVLILFLFKNSITSSIMNKVIGAIFNNED